MELKNKKIPKYGEGKIDWGSVVNAIGGLGTGIYKAHTLNETSNDYINNASSSTRYIGGIGFELRTLLNKNDLYNELNSNSNNNTFALGLLGLGTGLSIGTLVSPGLGTLIGGLVGTAIGVGGGILGKNSKLNKFETVYETANKYLQGQNKMNEYSTYTEYLQQKLAEKYGDTRSLQLFHDGKPSYVHTKYGVIPGIPNSNTNLKEVISSKDATKNHVVDEGPNDTAPSYVEDDDYVFGGTKERITGKKFQDLARPVAQMLEKIDKNRPKGKGPLGESARATYDKAALPYTKPGRQYLKNLGNLMNAEMINNSYKCGKPSYDKGKPNESSNVENTYGLNWWDNVIPAGINSLIGLLQLMSAWKDEPYNPHTYVPNRYANKSLATLAGLRIDPYGTILLLRDAEARTNNAITSSGGLSTAQKNLSRIASLHGTQQQIGNMLNSIQAQNNSYFQHYADTMLLHGLSEAQRLQSAKQYDLEYYSKAHAAKKNMEQMGMYNLANTAWTYASNEFKRKNAIANLKLYADNNKIEQAKLDAWLNANTPKDDSLIIIDKSNPAMVYKPEILDLAGVFKKPQLATQSIPKWTWQPPQNLWLDGINKKYGW